MNTAVDETYLLLKKAFDHFNAELFGGTVPDCLLSIRSNSTEFGYFSSGRFKKRDGSARIDEIALNPHFFGVRSVRRTLQTLAHEMVHLWQYNHGKPARPPYHNKEWAEKMKAIGLFPSSTGGPGGKETGDRMGDYPIEGGPFLASVDRLLATGFDVLWADMASAGGYGLIAEAERRSAGESGGEALGESPDDGGGAEPEKKKKSGVRVKYVCPGCKASVWGKSGLSIRCDDCDESFEGS